MKRTYAEKAEQLARKLHSGTNHKYDGKDYVEAHVSKVVDYATEYINLIPERDRDIVIAAAWLHDTIEDTRATPNDLIKGLSYTHDGGTHTTTTEIREIVNIVFALTNDKGWSRHERAGEKYYAGIRATRYADFVKLCDRLANVSNSIANGHDMKKAYEKEYLQFRLELGSPTYGYMWHELDGMLLDAVLRGWIFPYSLVTEKSTGKIFTVIDHHLQVDGEGVIPVLAVHTAMINSEDKLDFKKLRGDEITKVPYDHV